jgi:1-acyl-sn-glycerol-3-phosphate acyltransferase
VIAANHNSHLDTLVLMTLLPAPLLHKLRPLAAADYFLRNRLLAWFALRVMRILPVERGTRGAGGDPLAGAARALSAGEIVLLFPEGTRGDAERLSEFKSGVARLAERFPHVPVVPVFLHGLGKALPRGAFWPVPFFCDVFVGEPVPWTGERKAFVAALREAIEALAAEDRLPAWE